MIKTKNTWCITTFDGNLFRWEEDVCYELPADGFTNHSTFMRIVGNRVESIYYESHNRCGLQYLGKAEFKKLHPYYDYYRRLIPANRLQYIQLLTKIKGSDIE